MKRITNENYEEVLTGMKLAEVACAINLLKEYQSICPIDHLRELAQAEKDGRLVVLPFCIGVPLYEATGKGVREYQVEQFSIGNKDLFIQAVDKCIWYRGGRIFGTEQIGKTVFPARREAEAALKKRRESDEPD